MKSHTALELNRRWSISGLPRLSIKLVSDTITTVVISLALALNGHAATVANSLKSFPENTPVKPVSLNQEIKSEATPAPSGTSNTSINSKELPSINSTTIIHKNVEEEPVLHFELNEDIPIAFPTAPNRTTTILFPFVIQNVHGATLTKDPKKLGGNFYAEWKPGENYMSIIPMREDVRGNFNVILNGRVYAFEAYPSSTPSGGAYTVILNSTEIQSSQFLALHDATNNERGQQTQSAVTSPLTSTVGRAAGLRYAASITRANQPPQSEIVQANDDQLLGSLTTIKLLAGVENQDKANQLACAIPNLNLVVRASGDSTDHGDHAIELTHVTRNNKLGTLAFAVNLINKGNKKIEFRPNSFVVRTGDPTTGILLSQVVSEMPTALGPKEKKRAFFVIDQLSNGERNQIDPRNTFSISLEKIAQQNSQDPSIIGRTASTTKRDFALKHIKHLEEDVKTQEEVAPRQTKQVSANIIAKKDKS